jgi:hypothetical protein
MSAARHRGAHAGDDWHNSSDCPRRPGRGRGRRCSAWSRPRCRSLRHDIGVPSTGVRTPSNSNGREAVPNRRDWRLHLGSMSSLLISTSSTLRAARCDAHSETDPIGRASQRLRPEQLGLRVSGVVGVLVTYALSARQCFPFHRRRSGFDPEDPMPV